MQREFMFLFLAGYPIILYNRKNTVIIQRLVYQQVNVLNNLTG